jgi:O-antigen/teichoic acid export membrane protein
MRIFFSNALAALSPTRLAARYGNSTVSLVDQGIVSAVNFLTIVLLARTLSLLDFGVFMVAHTILTLLTGLQNALVTQPHNILGAQREGLEYARLTVVLGLLQFSTSLVVVAIIAVVGGVLLINESIVYAHLAFALAVIVIPWMAQEFVRRVLYTQGDTVGATINNLVSYGLQLVGIVVVIGNIGVAATPVNAFLALGGSSLIAALLGVWQLRHRISPQLLSLLPEWRSYRAFKISAADTWHVSKWLLAQQGMAWLGVSGHGWILTAFLGPASFGVYRAAYQVVNILNPVRQAAMNHLPSRGARVFSQHGMPGLAQWTKRVVPMLAIPFGLGALAIAIGAEPLAELIYGAKELPDLNVIVAMGALAYTISFARTPLDYAVLIGNGGRQLFMRTVWLAAFVMTGGVALIWAFGIYGAMASEVITAIISAVLTLRVYATIVAAPRTATAPPTKTLSISTAA